MIGSAAVGKRMVMKCIQDILDVCKFNWIYFILIVTVILLVMLVCVLL